MLCHLVIDVSALKFVVDRFIIHQGHVIKPFATNQKNLVGKNLLNKKIKILFVINFYCIEFRRIDSPPQLSSIYYQLP